MFSRKIRHVAIRSGFIRWISIRFDAVLGDPPTQIMVKLSVKCFIEIKGR